MERSKKPAILTAGKVVNLTYGTFIYVSFWFVFSVTFPSLIVALKNELFNDNGNEKSLG